MAAPQQQSSEGSMGILWTIAAFFAALGIVWYVFKTYLILAYFHLKLWEAELISLVMSSLGFQAISAQLYRVTDILQTLISTRNFEALTFHDVSRLGEIIGNYYRYPFVLLLLILAVLVYLGNTTRVFKRTYSMKSLVELEKTNWPQITPVVGLDLLKQDVDKGPWASALTPIQFCKKHNLLEEYRAAPREGSSRKDRDKIEVALKRGLATKVFSLQLGPGWQGVNRLPPHARALFAAFAARINADSKASAEFLIRIAASSAGKLNFSGTDELLKKYLSSKPVKKIIESHAYVLTVMASMLAGARTDGVQASADFLWLKPIDRRMWYVLNTIGRQVPFVESAGPFAHWRAEKEMGKRIIIPMVEEATNALEIALKEIIYKPDEPDNK
jgi:intracellular multiplication protein IcmP